MRRQWSETPFLMKWAMGLLSTLLVAMIVGAVGFAQEVSGRLSAVEQQLRDDVTYLWEVKIPEYDDLIKDGYEWREDHQVQHLAEERADFERDLGG